MATFFVVVGIIIMVLSGGCSLLFMADLNSPYVTLDAIALIGGVPFIVGALIFSWQIAVENNNRKN